MILTNLSRFGINPEGDTVENNIVYCTAGVFSLLERKITDYLRAYNLSPSQFNALMIIKHIGKEKGLSQIEIGDRLIVTASNMTRLLDKLTKEGLIERTAQENDRRVNLIKITEKGSKMLDQAWPGYQKVIQEITNGLTKSDLKQLSDLLLKWFNVLDTTEET